jgi:DNA-binding winged helix-turn-helix (wHTH) protein
MTSTENMDAAALEICIARRTARFAGREMKLPDLSFRLLRLLGERAPEPVAFAEIEQGVWGAQVSRETIKQRVKMLRDSLAGLGLRGGVESARNVGYRLTRPLGMYGRPVEAVPWWRGRLVRLAAAGLTACAGAVVLYFVQAGEEAAAGPLTLSILSNPAAASAQSSTPAWEGARRLLIRDLSRLSGLAVVSGDGDGRPTDLVVEMERIPLDGRETMALELLETDTGVVLWAETYPFTEASWDRAVSHFVANIHAQIEMLGLRLGQDGFPHQPRKVQELYLSASSLARSDTEADLLAARMRLKSALAMRPNFALARALRARIDARLAMGFGHGPQLADRALAESRLLVEAHPDVPEFRRALATAQIATGDLPEALQNLEIAQRDMPFLRRDVLALKQRIELEGGE